MRELVAWSKPPGDDFEPERVLPIEIEISEYDTIPTLVGDFVEVIRRLGPNPYKL